MRITNFIEIANKNRNESFGQCKQFYEAAESYLSNNPLHPNFIKVLKQTDSVLVKFLMASVNLEYLWQIKYAKPNHILYGSSYELEWENSLSFTDYFYFDNFIHQSQSYLDHIKSLILICFGIDKKWRNNKDFFDKLSKLKNEKASEITNLIAEIYSDGNWGKELSKLRNQISHNRIFQTLSEYKPKINEKHFENYCQEIENNMFVLLTEIQEKLFEVKWVSGKI
jgi:predicted DNA-binding ribbon-helix-helix protein